jgi:hypothetical protein
MGSNQTQGMDVYVCVYWVQIKLKAWMFMCAFIGFKSNSRHGRLCVRLLGSNQTQGMDVYVCVYWVQIKLKAWTFMCAFIGFKSNSRHGCLCVRLFSVCVVLCIGSGLTMA